MDPVEKASKKNNAGERQAGRPQQPGDGAAAEPVLHYLEDCVVKVICERPATREASITRITDWWVAVASALMMTIGSRRPAPALRSAPASCSMLVNSTGALLIRYWPLAFTSTLTSPGRSSCFSASAVGRLICSSVYFE